MNDLENRLTAALTERVAAVTHSSDAWEQNQARLAGQVRPPSRFRAPLLIAAAVLAITATVAVVGATNRPEPVAPPVVEDTSDCAFGHDLPGSTGLSSSATDTGILIAISGTTRGRACFFDGVTWHAGSRLGDNSPILTTGRASAAGHTWWWAILSAQVGRVEFVDSAGNVIPANDKINITSSSGGQPGTNTAIVRELTGSGTVRVLGKDGGLMQEQSYDMSSVPVDVGPVILDAPAPADPTKPVLQSEGHQIICPSGAATATAVQKVSDGSSITLSLHEGAVAGESALCLVADAGSTSKAVPVGFIPVSDVPGGPFGLAGSQTGTPVLWGAVSTKVSRVDITIGAKVTRFVAAPVAAGNTDVLMSSLGSYRTFALPAPSATVASKVTTFDAAGKMLYTVNFGG